MPEYVLKLITFLVIVILLTFSFTNVFSYSKFKIDSEFLIPNSTRISELNYSFFQDITSSSYRNHTINNININQKY